MFDFINSGIETNLFKSLHGVGYARADETGFYFRNNRNHTDLDIYLTNYFSTLKYESKVKDYNVILSESVAFDAVMCGNIFISWISNEEKLGSTLITWKDEFNCYDEMDGEEVFNELEKFVNNRYTVSAYEFDASKISRFFFNIMMYKGVIKNFDYIYGKEYTNCTVVWVTPDYMIYETTLYKEED